MQASRKTRYPEDFGWNLQSLVTNILTHIRDRHTEKFVQRANRSIAEFVKVRDSLVFLFPQLISLTKFFAGFYKTTIALSPPPLPPYTTRAAAANFSKTILYILFCVYKPYCLSLSAVFVQLHGSWCGIQDSGSLPWCLQCQREHSKSLKVCAHPLVTAALTSFTAPVQIEAWVHTNRVWSWTLCTPQSALS